MKGSSRIRSEYLSVVFLKECGIDVLAGRRLRGWVMWGLIWWGRRILVC